MMMVAMLAVSFAMQAQTKFHDVELNEAKGAVKCIKTNQMGRDIVINFSEDGKMSQEGMSDAKYDENGYIQSAKMSVQGQEAEVKFTWEDGKMVKQTVSAMGQDIATSFVYDENGLVKTVKMNMMGQDVEIPVTDYKFDDKGNWISRKMSMMGQEMEEARTITYFE